MTHLLSNECRLGGGPSRSRKLTTETKGEVLRRIGIRGVEGRNCEWKPTWKSGIRTRVVREYIASTGVDSPEHFKEVEAANSGITFEQQAESWLAHMRNRKRKPISPKTAQDWEYCLEKWLKPSLSQMLLTSINNHTV